MWDREGGGEGGARGKKQKKGRAWFGGLGGGGGEVGHDEKAHKMAGLVLELHGSFPGRCGAFIYTTGIRTVQIFIDPCSRVLYN